MGLFNSLLFILMPPVGLIHIDYNQKIVNETIELADELYSRCGENVEDAFVYIEFERIDL
jgi:hypothetical protein